PARYQRANALPDQMPTTFAGFDHLARKLETEDVRRSRRRRIEPTALQDVGAVDPRRRDLDKDFVRPGARYRPLDQRQLLGAVGLRRHHGHHRGRNRGAHKSRLIDLSAPWVNDSAMDLEELFPSKPGDPLVELARQDLDPLSIEELQLRIEALKAEIARVE